MAKNVGSTVRCEECQRERLMHSKLKLKRDGSQGANDEKNCLIYARLHLLSMLVPKIEMKISTKYFLCENISGTSKVELLYYPVDYYAILCIHCGVGGTQIALNKSVEYYP